MENVSHNTSWSVNSEIIENVPTNNNGYIIGTPMQAEEEDENVELS
jgi:hypothetical protein